MHRTLSVSIVKDTSLVLTTLLMCGAPALSHAEASTDSSLPSIDVRAAAAPSQKNSLVTGIPVAAIDTPFSVSTVSTETLQDQGGITLHDLLRNVPGATADLGFTGSHSQVFVLRGPGAAVGTRSEPSGTVQIVTKQPLSTAYQGGSDLGCVLGTLRTWIQR